MDEPTGSRPQQGRSRPLRWLKVFVMLGIFLVVSLVTVFLVIAEMPVPEPAFLRDQPKTVIGANQNNHDQPKAMVTVVKDTPTSSGLHAKPPRTDLKERRELLDVSSFTQAQQRLKAEVINQDYTALKADHEVLYRIEQQWRANKTSGQPTSDPDDPENEYLQQYRKLFFKLEADYEKIREKLQQLGDPALERRLKENFLRYLASKEEWNLAIDFLRFGDMGAFEGENFDLAVYFSNQAPRPVPIKALNLGILYLNRFLWNIKNRSN